MRRRRRLRAGLLATTALAAAALGVAAWGTDAFESLEVRTIDARFDVRGSEKRNPEVAIVGIDEQTLSDLRLQPPLPRSLHARVIDRLKRDGAKVIAYDLEFTSETEPREDNALIEATRRAGNVVLATSRIGEHGEVDVFGGAEGVAFARATVGSAVIRSISGRVYRFPRGESGIPSFSVAAVQRAGRRADASGFEGNEAWVDFAGPPGTYEPIPFVRVLRGRFRPGTFRDRIVIVGSTAPVIKDIASTATGEQMPGPEIQANAMATILDGFPLGEAPGGLTALLLVLVGLSVPAAAVPLHGLRWLGVPVVVLALFLAGAQLAFDGGTILPVVPGLIALAVGVLGTLAITNFVELRDRRRLRAQFARFVPAPVVDEVVERAESEDLRLGGTRRDGTVLFCDLRGFTACAEGLEAEQVIDLLNRYLTEMSGAILDAGGTVVSYMGDGIMAVFGAPLEQDDHADRALRAAREMLERRLPRFNDWASERGLADGFAMGIGICSGPVMSGNVGSQRRLEYTAVGDTTNTASRLEAMTKDRGVAVLIAESTRARLAVSDDLVSVGELSVRGRAATISAWTLRQRNGGD